jgi:hypothetical protein
MGRTIGDAQGDVYPGRRIKYHWTWLYGSDCFLPWESFLGRRQSSTPGGVAQMVRATDS